MEFPYQLVDVESVSTGEMQEITRPEILVGVEGPKRIELVVGLVDTGADYSLLPTSLAASIGVELRPAQGSSVVGVAGHSLGAQVGEVTFILEDGETTLVWTALALFADAVNVRSSIVGRAGFLEFFTATFDGERSLATLEPNGRFPGEIVHSTD